LPSIFALRSILLWQNYRLRSAKKFRIECRFSGAPRLHQAAKRANQCVPIRAAIASYDRSRDIMKQAMTEFRLPIFV
jgi:hypothetical protein